MAVYRRKWEDKETGNIHLGSFYFKFDVDGVTYKETVKTARTKKQAEEAERQARQAIHEGVYGVTAKKQLFSTFVRDVYLPWAKQHRRQFRNYEYLAEMLCEYFKDRTLAQISPLAVEGFKRKRAATPTMHKRPRSPVTLNCELTALSSIMGQAVKKKLLRANPCHAVEWLEEEERPIRRLAAAEESALFEAAELGPGFLAPMCRLALWTGFRQGELIALGKGAVSFPRGRVFILNPKWKRDHRKTEGVPMSSPVRALLETLCSRAPGDLLFTNADGSPLERYTVDWHFTRARDRAGVTGLRFHDLRHEFGSRLGDADVNLKKIAYLMGHARTKQTERYVHPSDDGLTAAAEIAARPTGRRPRIVPIAARAAG